MSVTAVTQSIRPITQFAFFTLNDTESLIIDADLNIMGITWIVNTGCILTITSDLILNNAGNNQGSMEAEQYGTLMAKNGTAPISGLTFSASGGSVTFTFIL